MIDQLYLMLSGCHFGSGESFIYFLNSCFFAVYAYFKIFVIRNGCDQPSVFLCMKTPFQTVAVLLKL